MNSKKQQIVTAAYTLFINKGYNASSIQDILDEAGVSKGTFYKHFTSKSECLIAIMESITSEIRQKRMAAALGKSNNDSEVLAEQLCIRIQLNLEKNLFSLYESIFYSQDEELKEFAKYTYVSELDWISSRIVDIFGEKAAPFALENAAILHGSILQLVHMWKLTSRDELPTKQLAAFVVNRMHTAILHQIESGDSFLRNKKLPIENQSESITLESLVHELNTYSREMIDSDNVQQLITFLSEELLAKNPRMALIESVLSTLAKNDSVEPELTILLEQVWTHLPKRQLKS